MDNPTKTQKQDVIIEENIRKILEKRNYRYGARKIKIKLDELGILASEKIIRKLMKKMNVVIDLNNKEKRKYPPKKGQIFYKNRLQQKFKQSAPDIAWVSDTTQKRVNKKKYYICVIIDLFSRKVIAYNFLNFMIPLLLKGHFQLRFMLEENQRI